MPDDSVVTPEEKTTVDLTPPAPAPSAEEALVAKIKADYDSLYGSRVEQLEQRNRGAQRIIEQTKRELDEVKAKLATLTPSPAPTVSATNPYDQLVAEGKWQDAVKRLAKEEMESTLQAQRALELAEQQKAQRAATLQASMTWAVARYPQLDPTTGNEEDPISQRFAAVLTAHPEYLSDPHGPRLAVQEMEDQLRGTNGDGVKAPTRTPKATMAPARDGKVSVDTVELTKEQKDWAEFNGIPLEMYAKILKAAGEAGEVVMK